MAANGVAVANGSAEAPAAPVSPTSEDASRKRLWSECLSAEEKVRGFLAEEGLGPRLQAVQHQARVAMDVIRRALETYSLDQLSLSYNGGKDCLVLLILLLATLPSVYGPPSSSSSSSEPTKKPPPPPSSTPTADFPPTLQSIYVVSRHPFAEVDSFVDATAARYRLDLRRYGMGMKQALRHYLDDRPRIRAVFVGTRRTDPHGAKLTHFDETDDGWPRFMRVHPVIDWHYAEIWEFIRHLRIPYCTLYDQGYTSLGGTTDTHPNPALKVQDASVEGGVRFRPAYELYEDEAERLGRD